jgi:hypothetical protein
MNIIHRRKGTAVSEVATEELDTRPLYLRIFPSASLMLLDVEVGVLMGRQEILLYSFTIQQAQSRFYVVIKHDTLSIQEFDYLSSGVAQDLEVTKIRGHG